MISGARPVYPAEAKSARVQGVVRVAYSITKTGEVSDVHVVSGDLRLVPAALAALAKWRFAPCRPPGMREAVEVRTESDLSFTLNQ